MANILPQELVYEEDCALDFALDVLAKKWNINIILEFITDARSLSFSEIAAKIPEISPRMLSMRLKFLIENGLIHLIGNEDKPKKVRYKLSRQGQELAVVLKLLREWSIKYGNCENQKCLANECKHGKAITKMIELHISD